MSDSFRREGRLRRFAPPRYVSELLLFGKRRNREFRSEFVRKSLEFLRRAKDTISETPFRGIVTSLLVFRDSPCFWRPAGLIQRTEGNVFGVRQFRYRLRSLPRVNTGSVENHELVVSPRKQIVVDLFKSRWCDVSSLRWVKRQNTSRIRVGRSDRYYESRCLL